MKKAALVTLLMAAVLASPALAQPIKDKVLTFSIGAGYSVPYDLVDDFFDGGLGVDFSVIYMPRRGHFGAWGGLGYAGLDVNDETLELIGVNDGDMRIWSLQGGGIWSTRTTKMFNFYVTAGAGWYHREIDLVNPALEVVPGWCSPWWDYCNPASVVQTEDFVGKNRENNWGYNAGIGVTFTLKNKSQIYVDLRFNSIQTDVETEFVPFVVGYRW
jgi:opacity protein-like surface antigen